MSSVQRQNVQAVRRTALAGATIALALATLPTLGSHAWAQSVAAMPGTDAKPDAKPDTRTEAKADAKPASSPARTPAWAMTLLFRDGRAETIDVRQISVTESKGNLTYVTPGGESAKASIDDVLALAPESWSIAGTPEPVLGERAGGLSVLDLCDGQRLIGRAAPAGNASGSADSVAWWTERFGVMSVGLDRIAQWSVAIGPQPVGKAPTTDQLTLSNGDRLEGVVDSFGQNIVLAPAGVKGGDARRLPLGDVASVVFANPAQARGLVYAWLIDGSVVRLTEIATEDGRVRVRAADAGAKAGATYLKPSDIVGVAFGYTHARALSAMPVAASKAAGGLVFAPSVLVRSAARESVPMLGAADVVLPGAMSAEWELNAGGTWFAASIGLADDSRVWGDCEVVLSVIGTGERAAQREVVRERLRGDRPVALIAAKIDAKPKERLQVRIEPGPLGPIQNRVVLKHALIIGGANAPATTPSR